MRLATLATYHFLREHAKYLHNASYRIVFLWCSSLVARCIRPGFYPGMFLGISPHNSKLLLRIFATSVITSRTLRLKSHANYSTGICYLLSEMRFVVLRKPLKLFSAGAPPRTLLWSLRRSSKPPSRLETGIHCPNSSPLVSVSAPSASRFSRLPRITGRSMLRKISEISPSASFLFIFYFRLTPIHRTTKNSDNKRWTDNDRQEVYT